MLLPLQFYRLFLDKIFSLFIHCPLEFFLYPRSVHLRPISKLRNTYFSAPQLPWCFETDLMCKRKKTYLDSANAIKNNPTV